MKIKDSNTFKLKEVIIIVLVTALVVSFSTILIISKRINSNPNDETKVVETSQEELDTFIKAYKTILENYYQDVDQKELINTLITAMTNYLKDPYTSFLDKESTKELMSTLNGEYEGIGVKITKTDLGVTILNVFDNSPAKDSGLLPGDVITKINDIDTTKMEVNEVVSTISNNKNNKMSITILRESEYKTFELSVTKVNIPSVEKNIIEENGKKIGYLYISTFALNTYSQFKSKLEELESNNIDSLIIDVRTDNGGYLASATEIIELFLKKGQIMYGVKTKEVSENFLDETDEHREYKIVLIGNEYSASASEILIAALKDSYGALLVGKTTYGKGKIQQTSSLEDGSMLKYTTAQWLTPKGICIDTIGIKPDYEEEYTLENDAQLKKAIELLKE